MLTVVLRVPAVPSEFTGNTPEIGTIQSAVKRTPNLVKVPTDKTSDQKQKNVSNEQATSAAGNILRPYSSEALFPLA